jgi:hypothetical protein
VFDRDGFVVRRGSVKSAIGQREALCKQTEGRWEDGAQRSFGSNTPDEDDEDAYMKLGKKEY